MPRYATKKNKNCEVCNKRLGDRSAQRRHHQKFHPEHVDLATTKSTEKSQLPNRRRPSRRQEALAVTSKTEDIVRQRIVKGLDVGMKVREIEGKGRGVISRRTFQKGEFVCDYAGELIDAKKAREREIVYENEEKGCFMFFFEFRNDKLCVDATNENDRKGRLLNHSKKNFNVVAALHITDDYPHIVFHAARKILPSEELVYDYGDTSKKSLDAHGWLGQ